MLPLQGDHLLDGADVLPARVALAFVDHRALQDVLGLLDQVQGFCDELSVELHESL
ncbi:hypothetical protein [Streptomyces lavendulocolor]|uniref:hypothetical protein n=1 Tax=Streptomyces lavendulocolor TaxID=67316 RepID=UPI00340233CD